MIKCIFSVKTDHFEGSTASGRRQIKLRYLFWIQNCQRIRIFPGIRGKNYSLVLMIDFSNILMLFMILSSFFRQNKSFSNYQMLRIIRSNDLNKRNSLMHKNPGQLPFNIHNSARNKLLV